ncbi:MAG: polysaccharide pyruvyl transferase family protein [Oscillospiraceae bacterium]|nr:polysaccharide pyruvyl transferase family protein [Oscillospiraceae bacterium]
MKIGIMTFHWAANYGAVLQSYALAKHLEQAGHDVCDIDYLPRRSIWTLRFFDVYLRRFANLQMVPKFRRFRKRYLRLSPKTYHNYKNLLSIQNTYDAVIAGSDQIWNESFLMTAEKEPTLSYFLDFLPDDVCRLSYAASFGSNEIPDGVKRHALAALKKFDAISVREENAAEFLADEGLSAVTVCDPTLLLGPEGYKTLVQGCCDQKKVALFNFMLRKGRSSSDDTESFLKNEVFAEKANLGKEILSVEQWLWTLKNSDFVVTDSFHCTVFAILFHKPFLAVNDKDCAMNARIKTLTQKLGLEHRVVDCFDRKKICEILEDDKFDWTAVDRRREQWAAESAAFLREALAQCNREEL